MSNIITQTLPRDIRVDHIGYVQELARLWADGLKAAVKLRMGEDGISRVQGDQFEALLSQSSRSPIDAAKFLKLYEAGLISRKQLLAAITVNTAAAAEFLSPEQLRRISGPEITTCSLRIARKQGVQVTLCDAVRAVAKAAPSTLG